MKKTLLLLMLTSIISSGSVAQHKPPFIRCGTMENLEILKQLDPTLEDRMMDMELAVQRWLDQNPDAQSAVAGLIKIPVVVHVLWNDSNPAGNISEEQIRSQIKVLCDDFRRKNSDTTLTPPGFLPHASDCKIEFELARQDPDSNPTSGILRKRTIVNRFLSDSNDIKFSHKGGSDAWPSSKYINVWVGTLGSSLLGYAQFPGGPDSTDGVVVAYDKFGTIGEVIEPFDKGRTATHEIGHWLNMRHIWGDDKGACTGNDNVGDTPDQADATSGCPGYPHTDACTNSGNGIMFMNYMDYSDDTCMNIYTTGQKNRMRATLNTGARIAIKNSPGGNLPVDSNQILKWAKSYGGSSVEFARSVKATTDGGYVMAGYSWSSDGDVTGIHGSNDFWVVKISDKGNIQWQKCLGSNDNDVAFSIVQTFDGGYVVAGNTFSNTGQVTGNHGSFDYWVVKLSSQGTIEWQKCLGGTGADYGQCIAQTSDSGYIVAGYTNSNDGDVSGNHGGTDYWVVKLSATGSLQWQKCLGGTGNDFAHSVIQASNGTYLVAGYTQSGTIAGYHGGAADFWLVKISSTGNAVWKKCFGGSLADYAYTVKPSLDGGYIVAGSSNSINGDVSGVHGWEDYWVIKVSSAGTLLWQKALGGSLRDYAYDIHVAADSGFVIAGYSNSANGDVSVNQGGYDFWVVKVNKNGNLIWEKSFGGTGNDYAQSICQALDGTYAMMGYTNTNSGDVTGNHGLEDFWLATFYPCRASITPDPSQVYCPNTVPAITLTANEEGSYLWSTGATTKSVSVSASGSYTVTVSNGGCNEVSKPVNVAQLSCNGAAQLSLTALSGTDAGLEWENASCGKDGYELQYRYFPNGTWFPVIEIPFESDGIYQYVLGGLFTSTKYEVRIRSDCGAAVYSPWKKIRFETDAFRPYASSGTSRIKIQSNPATDVLNYELEMSDSRITITIYDMMGRRISGQHVAPVENVYRNIFDIRSLDDGMYLLVAQGETERVVCRFVKE